MRGASDGLTRLLDPSSVALVGASDDVTRIGGRPLRYLREAGFAGTIYPVNPKRDTVQGQKAYPSLGDIPATPDVAILAVPAAGTVQAVRECADRGVRSAIIFSAGFAEQDEAGRALQDEIVAIARGSGMRLLGPNCLGVFNAGSGFYGTFSAMLDTGLVSPGPIGIVSQSGAYGSHMMHLARKRGLGMRYMVTTGNECDIGAAEALRWMVDQPDINVVMAYAEGIRDGETFIEALELARSRRKAIVFMKVGRSDVGARAVSSHTAALAGSDAVFDAVFRQYGVWRASTTAEQLDIVAACSRGLYPRSNSLGIFTLSGGFGIQMADDAEAAGLDVKSMPDSAQAELKAILPYASPRNPVDATAQAITDLPLMTRFIATMLEKGDYGFFAGIFGSGPASPTFAGKLSQALAAAAAASGETMMALTMSAPQEIVGDYQKQGFLVAEDGTALMKTLGALVHFARSFDRAGRGRPAEPLGPKVEIASAPMSEMAARDILTPAGIPFPATRLVRPGEDVAAASQTVGYPQVLKIVSPDIAHKTEIGGVLLGIRSADEAEAGVATILGRAAEREPDARIDGVMIAPMIADGVETIAGVVRDPVFGPVVMFGLGGVFVEVLRDVTFRVAPFDVEEALRMIREIRGFPMLQGVRGAPPSDIDALAAALSALSRFAAANADAIDSIDLNPLRVLAKGRGVVALDALIVPRGYA